MGILVSRRDRPCGGGGGGQPVLSSGANTTRFFGGEDASGGCGRSSGREAAEVVRASRSCSGARGEAKAIGVARREARRLSWGVDPEPGRRGRARGGRAGEGFDDDHPTATTGAAAPRRRSFGVR